MTSMLIRTRDKRDPVDGLWSSLWQRRASDALRRAVGVRKSESTPAYFTVGSLVPTPTRAWARRDGWRDTASRGVHGFPVTGPSLLGM